MAALVQLESPPDYGLPEKFSAWRPQQLRAISDGLSAAQSGKRFIVQCLSTGSGKTISNVMQGMIAGRAAYLTMARALQDQICDPISGDAASVGAVDIRGRSNYHPCVFAANSTATCEDGVYMGCKAHKEGLCPYVNKLEQARESMLPVSNYAYWMAINKYSEGLGPVDMLICDEADQTVNAICNMMTIEITNRELHALQLKPPTDTTLEGWQAWSKGARKRVDEEVDKQAGWLKRNVADHDALKMSKSLKSFTQKLETLLNATGRWVSDNMYEYASGVNHQTGYRLDPIWPTAYAEELLFCGAPRVLLTSATLSKKTCSLLGIPESDIAYFDYPPVFDPARAPITWLRESGRIDNRSSEMTIRAWVSRIDQIIRRWDGHKGVIHCVSYERQKEIYQYSKERSRLIWHNSWNTMDKVEEFKRASAASGKVLISPAVTSGFDFADDMCRFCIIAKIPMADTRSKIMKARVEEDEDYGNYIAVQSLEQAVGRPIRNEKDWCYTYVTDDHWAWWYPKMLNRGLFTLGFRKRVTAPVDGRIPVLAF